MYVYKMIIAAQIYASPYIVHGLPLDANLNLPNLQRNATFTQTQSTHRGVRNKRFWHCAPTLRFFVHWMDNWTGAGTLRPYS
ncbi:hypothetical protein L3X38_001276 [Prunus dulcis]|uniref:Uncharacterized protein n=1 Tax=Prunus dulcis TaxID=3755 RepID=A0AAD4WRS1_PRUDU|nr:hypothetical protein L3X38_001276 [Prunus dulcis]